MIKCTLLQTFHIIISSLVAAAIFVSAILIFYTHIFLTGVLSLTFLALSGLFLFSLRPAKSSTVNNVIGSPWGSYTKNDETRLDCLKIVAHRACGLDAPENSLSALKKVVKEGITTIEFDVMLTHDKVPVVFHDESLLRMASVPKLIESLTFDELQKIDISVAHPFGKNYVGEKVPSLNSFIQCCLDLNVKMIIDIKDASMSEAVINVFKKFPLLEEMALISSFDPSVIYKIRNKLPQLVGCLAWRPYYYSYEEYSGITGPLKRRSNNPLVHGYNRLKDCIHGYLLRNFVYHILGLSALLLHKDMISRDVIEYWRTRGIRVLAWTVNSPIEKDFFERFLEIPYLTDTVICS